MLTNGSGITSADMKRQSARQTPIRSRPTMLNSVTIWLDWLASPVVFLAARTPWNVPYVYLSSASTADNSTSNCSQVTFRMSWTSLAHYFRHSPIKTNIPPQSLSVRDQFHQFSSVLKSELRDELLFNEGVWFGMSPGRYPCTDSNCALRLRRPTLCPLSYRGGRRDFIIM